MSLGLYALGYVVVVIGIIYIAHLMHIPQTWLIGIVIVLAGIGLTTMAAQSRGKGPN